MCDSNKNVVFPVFVLHLRFFECGHTEVNLHDLIIPLLSCSQQQPFCCKKIENYHLPRFHLDQAKNDYR